MRKVIIALLAIASVVGCVASFFILSQKIEEAYVEEIPETKWLYARGDKIVSNKGREIQLKGISTHGIQWFGDLYNAESIKHLRDEMGINLFRIAMYTDANAKGYVANKALKEKVYELADAAIALDMYVIIDWHILGDNNPQTNKADALEFFAEVSEKYADEPLVIYEICNEPNGGVKWETDIKPYAEEVIAAIRKNSPESLIIVGTPDYSKDFIEASQAPLDDENVAYALHFYAGSHNKTLRDAADDFRKKGHVVFVSECGATDASGAGQLYEDAFERWATWMKENKISWTYWAYANKDEASSMLKAGVVPDFAAEDYAGLDSYLSPSGALIKRMLAL